MKKALVLILTILLLTLGITACGSGTERDSLTVKEGVLRVGMDLQYPPFETFDDTGNPTGISVDVAQGFADELRLELEVVNMDFSTLIPALETGDIDIAIASMSIIDERQKKVDFSKPYFYFKIIGLMNKGFAISNGLDENADAADLWQINETRFVGLTGQISTDIPQQFGYDVEESVDKAAAITEIVNGRADMLLISPEVVVGAHNAHKDTTAVFWTPLDVSPIGMAVAKGNSALLQKANAFINHMDDQDGVYDAIRTKYADVLESLYDKSITLDYYIYE